MSFFLQCILFVACLFTAWFLIHKIRKAQIQIEKAGFWIGLSVLLLFYCLFPGVVGYLATITGIATPINFIYLTIIFLLLIKLFTTSVHVSQLDNKINQLTQQIALLDYEERERAKNA